MSVRSIRGVVHLDDGRTVEFEADAEGATRWGATRDTLGDAVDVTDKLATIIADQN